MRLVVVKVTVSSLPLIYVVWVTGHRLVIVSKTSVWALFTTSGCCKQHSKKITYVVVESGPGTVA
jgi:hypothetical protein